LALDALYESVRQRVHLTNLGVLILYAVQKGEKMKNCEKRVRDAFRRFFPFQQSTEYDMYSWTFERELNWVKALI
jgi:hypothetical protein